MAQTLLDGGVRLVSGGTDNHLMLMDVCSRGRTGREVQELLDRANITANKNAIPRDPKGPNVTSGVRLGTPAVTSRGMKEADMDEIADCIAKLVFEGQEAVEGVKARVLALCECYPLYENDIL
jgi:glycine hydroxymethyltransferase